MHFYESLRPLREGAATEGAAISGVPSLSILSLLHALHLQKTGYIAAQAICRSFPLGCFLLSSRPVERSTEVASAQLKAFPLVLRTFQALFPSVSSPVEQIDPRVEAMALTTKQRRVASEMLEDLSLGRSVCVFGAKVSRRICTLLVFLRSY